MSSSYDNDHDYDYYYDHDNDHDDDGHNDDCDDDHDDNNSSISKKSKGSEVWLFFKKDVWEKKQKTAKCDVPKCPHKPFSCGTTGSTKTLWRHLESAHWSQYVTTKEYRKKKRWYKISIVIYCTIFFFYDILLL